MLNGIWRAGVLALGLVACVAAEAPELGGLRAGVGDHFYISGGFNDGAAQGQSMEVVITPADRVRCIFTFDPGLGIPPEVQQFDGTVFSLHSQIASAVRRSLVSGPLPAAAQGDFLVEFIQGDTRAHAALSWGEPGHGQLLDVILLHSGEVPCFRFG